MKLDYHLSCATSVTWMSLYLVLCSRWKHTMTYGCKTGQGLGQWDIIRQKATEASQYLDRELGDLLVSEVEGTGDDNVDGSTRRNLTAGVEDTRVAVLLKALEQYQYPG
jgi:hypothetical protein